MSKRLRCLFLLVLVPTFFALLVAADEKDKKPEKQVSELRFVVLKQVTGKPIRNASVVLHPVHDDGKQAKGGLQLKTDEQGRASITDIPFGKIRVQVIAPGMQTYGEDYVVDKTTMDFTIKMSRPTEQYSIYK